MDNTAVLTSIEIAKKWELSPRRVSVLCAEGRINGAIKKGKTWLIPAFSETIRFYRRNHNEVLLRHEVDIRHLRRNWCRGKTFFRQNGRNYE